MAQDLKTFSEALGVSPFYPELPRIELGEILGEDLVVLDAKVMKDFESEKYGNHDLALLRIQLKADEFTTACSGMVLCKKVQVALDRKLLPLKGKIVKDKYYDIL